MPQPHPALEVYRELIADNPDYLDEALTEEETAVIVGLAVSTLRSKRVRGGGPPFLRLGSSIRYRRRDLLDWMEQQG